MILKRFVAGYREFHPQFGFLFNSYYNSIGERTQRDQRGALSRPTVAEVFQYRKYVDEAMQKLLQNNLSDEITNLIILGLNHEQQHQELFLTDLKYSFSCNPLFPGYEANNIREEKCEDSANTFSEVAGGNYEIGFAGEGFCFDNELGRHQVFLPDFAICQKLVTNAEYLDFINDSGYENFRLWHSEGWDWVNQQRIKAPLYWHKREDEWLHFTLAGLREINWDAPICHVSFYERSGSICRMETNATAHRI
jgi:ergothioneine biosynthesis protein EgtB